MGLASEGRRYNPSHMLPAASPPTVEINGQPAQAYLSPKLQRPPVTPQGPKSALHTLLLTAALIFAAATVVYSCVWMYYVRLHPHVELGMDTTLFSSTEVSEITKVEKGSPADEAGLRTNDRIIGVDGKKLDAYALSSAWSKGRPGDVVTLTIQRPGVQQPLVIRATFRAPASPSLPLVRSLALQIMGTYPVVFLIVGLSVLFMRLEDPSAWLLALLFAGFIAVSDLPSSFMALHGLILPFMLGYRALFVGALTPLFYYFFAVFPARSPLDRHLPWLKWVLLGTGVSFGVFGLDKGGPEPWPALVSFMGQRVADRAVLAFIYGCLVLGLLSLTWNAFVLPTREARRKIRVIFWGTVVGVTPAAIARGTTDFLQFHVPFWLDFFDIIVLFIFPTSFAYAVVKHRVLAIPVLLRRSARYLLVSRGLIVFVLLVAVSITVLFTLSFSRFFALGSTAAMVVGVGFGVMLAWVSTPGLKQVTGRIDRAFFRGAYDARRILQDLAQKARTVQARQELALEMVPSVGEALHPSWSAVYVEAGPDYLESDAAILPLALKRIRKDSPGLEYLRADGEPWDASLSPTAYAVFSMFAPLLAECIVPFPSRSGDLLGLFVLGPRLSDEPYSSEDKMLLRSVASQAGVTLENLNLAEDIAERLQAERAVSQEMEIARQVQRKLFPQRLPRLKTLEYAGGCNQARAVGGDYYDFVELGAGRVGFVLADVAGKGMSAALLMANLQASIRSQYSVASENLPQILQSVNRLFYENSEPNRYTTLFAGSYDDAARRLRYVNCGHNPPLVLRQDGSVERLSATATVLGLFEQWQCSTNEVQFQPGDLLVLYSDGVTEAYNDREEEFGEARLIQVLEAGRNLEISALLTKLLEEVNQFSAGKQSDDVTAIVARIR
jgi:sigma-B regulation protein RsbU (phosphoserine phosphatase)